jgi:hypothetical protein
MANDERDILEVLKNELEFVEKGGYGRSVRTPWQPTSVFQDSLTCFCYPTHVHDDQCVLMKCVPPDQRPAGVPCHKIPLNEAGDTIETLEAQGDQQKLEDTVKAWLRKRISEIEAERVAKAS